MTDIQIERTPGFSDADGQSGISYKNANEAFRAYLKATNQPPTKENKAKCKAWLEKAKASGKFEKLVSNATGDTKDVVVQKEGEELKVVTQEVKEEVKPKPTGMPKGLKTGLWIGGAVVAIGLISWGVYFYMKKKKASSGGSGAAAGGGTGGTGAGI